MDWAIFTVEKWLNPDFDRVKKKRMEGFRGRGC
jgi:hypothetical protein